MTFALGLCVGAEPPVLPLPHLSCLGHSPTWGSSADARVPSWQHALPYPQLSAPHQVPKKGSENVDGKERESCVLQSQIPC